MAAFRSQTPSTIAATSQKIEKFRNCEKFVKDKDRTYICNLYSVSILIFKHVLYSSYWNPNQTSANLNSSANSVQL